MAKVVRYLDYLIYWMIILIPFSISIAPAPTSVFMGFLIAAYLAKKMITKGNLFTKTAIELPLLFFFIITCVSLIHSINYGDSLKGGILRLLQYIFIFFIIIAELKDKKHLNRIICSIGAGLILASVNGIWQVATGRDFIRGYAPVVNIGLVRATASFKDSNVLGIYLGAFAPLIFGLTLYYFKGKRKIALFTVSLVALIGIILTYSRPTLLAIYIVLFLFGVIKKDKVLVSVLVILFLLAPFILPQSVKNWAKEIGYNPLRFMCNDDRIAVYRNSLNMLKDHPFIGLGANTYMKNYKKYKESPEYRNIVTLDYMYAHNIYLQMAAEIGVVGLGIFIWFLYKLFSETRHIYRSLNDLYLKLVTLSLCGSLVAFLVNGLTESSLYYSTVAVTFWYISGLLISLKKFV